MTTTTTTMVMMMVVVVVIMMMTTTTTMMMMMTTTTTMMVMLLLLLFVSSLTSQRHASVSQGRICSDNFTCCHIEIEVADQTLYLTQAQYTDTGPTSPSADLITPGAWQSSTGVSIFKSLV